MANVLIDNAAVKHPNHMYITTLVVRLSGIRPTSSTAM